MHIHRGSGRPRVSLIDGIPMRIDLQRPVEMRSRFHGPSSVVRNFPAPENRLSLFIAACNSSHTSNASIVPPGKKCPTFFVLTTTSTRTSSPRRTAASTASQRRRNRAHFARRARRRPTPPLLRPPQTKSRAPAPRIASSPLPPRPFSRRRNRKNIHRHLLVLQKRLAELQLRGILDSPWAPPYSRPGNGANAPRHSRSPHRSKAPAACGNPRSIIGFAG